MNENLLVTGTVTRSTYDSLKKYLMRPTLKLLVLAAICVYNVLMLLQMFSGDWLPQLLMTVVFDALMVLVYLRSQKSMAKQAASSVEAIRKGDGIELTLHFEDQGIRMFNHTLGRELNVRYADFASYADTRRCVAVFLKKGNYVIIPKDNMDEALHDRVMALLLEKCPKLHKRF